MKEENVTREQVEEIRKAVANADDCANFIRYTQDGEERGLYPECIEDLLRYIDQQQEEIKRLTQVAHNNANVVREHKALLRLLSHGQQSKCWCRRAVGGDEPQEHETRCQQVREELGVKDE